MSSARTVRLFGIPLTIDPSWLFIAAFVTWTLATRHFPSHVAGLSAGGYWVLGAAAALLLFACVLLHELGHALAARSLGIPVTGITLFIFGGVAHIASEWRRPAVEFKVALAGPLVSLAIAVGCGWAARVMPREQVFQVAGVAIVHYLALVNTALICFNLLPGFPLDGGRLLRAALWGWTKDLPKATRVTSRLGSLLGLGLLGLGLWMALRGAWSSGVWYVLLGMFLHDAARASFARADQMTS